MRQSPPPRSSDVQRRVLLMSYAPDYLLCVRHDPMDTGVSPRTLRALVRRGLLQPESDGEWDEAQPTALGLRALGLVHSLPSDLRAALTQAIGELVPGGVQPEHVALGDQVPAVCVEEDWANDTTTWTDSSCALASVEVGMGGGWSDDPLGFEDMVYWSAVARRLSDAGWPVHATRYHHLVYLEPHDD
jgi:hypothetical protein